MEKCGLYLGCNIPFNAPDIEQSFRQVFPALGVEVTELEGASCCPAWGTAPSFDMNAWLALSARNITLAEAQGVDIMTGCNSCFGVLSEAKHIIDKRPEKKQIVNEKLTAINREYQGTSRIHHVSHVLHDKVSTRTISEKIRFNLEGLKIAIQPGCHLLWPSKIMENAEPDPFFPTHLKELCEALGAEAPHYSRLTGCCGMGAMRSADRKKSFTLVREKLRSMKEEIDPDIIVTTCSSCYLQFDSAQKLLRDNNQIGFSIPVLYYTQLLALAMDFDPAQVAAISETPRDEIIAEIQSDKRRVNQ